MCDWLENTPAATGASFPVCVVKCNPRPWRLLTGVQKVCSGRVCSGEWRIYEGKLTAEPNSSAAPWWSWTSPKRHLLAGHHCVFPWFLCFSYCLVPLKIPCALLLQVAALGCLMLTVSNPAFHTTKQGLQVWPHVSGALFAVSLLFVFFGNCKTRESWKGSRIKPSDRLVCLAVWQQAVSCPTFSSLEKVPREEIWVAGSFLVGYDVVWNVPVGGRSSKSDLRAWRCCEGGWGQAGPSAPGRLQGGDALQGTTSHLVGKGLSWWGMPWQGRDAGPGHIQQCTGGDSCWAV